MRAPVTPEMYTNPNHQQFVKDMNAAGIPVWHYFGRWMWEGPAAETDHDESIYAQDILSATKVRLQQDSMGLGSVHYPIARGTRVAKEVSATDLQDSSAEKDY